MSADEAHGTRRHWINSILPAPESFYDKDAVQLKQGRAAYVASPAAIASYSLLLYGLSGAAFAALLGFYSHPSQYLSETVIQSSWSRPGFECAPLQNDPHYGVNYSYTECLGDIVEPSATSLTLRSSESVSQTGFERTGGYACRPSQNDPHYDVSYTYTECLGNITPASMISVQQAGTFWNYFPFAELGKYGAHQIKSTELTEAIRAQNSTIRDVTYIATASNRDDIIVVFTSPTNQTTSFGSSIDQDEANEIFTYIMSRLGDNFCDFAKTNSPFLCTRRCYDYKPFSSSSVVIPETILTSAEATCNPSDAKRCATTTTQSEATDYFKCQRTSIGDSICDFTKTNSPFQCTRKQPIEVMQRISLSYAGAILVYSGLSVFFSWLMQYRKARIEKLRKVVASKGIVLTPESQESTV